MEIARYVPRRVWIPANAAGGRGGRDQESRIADRARADGTDKLRARRCTGGVEQLNSARMPMVARLDLRIDTALEAQPEGGSFALKGSMS